MDDLICKRLYGMTEEEYEILLQYFEEQEIAEYAALRKEATND